MRFFTLTLTALVVAAGAVVASDDMTIVTKHSQNGKETGTTTSYISSDHVRMAQDQGHETIVDLKTGVMTTLDGKKKTYYVVTKQDMERLKVKIQERMNDPEMKKAMEAMASMSAGMATSFDVKKTGTSRKVAGYGCEEWMITMGTLSTTRECVTSELQYPVHAWDTYKELFESMRSMMSAFSPMAKGGAELAEKVKNMKGFILATTTAMDIMGNKTTIASEVIEVRRTSISPSAWEISAGYTKVENPMLKAFESHGERHPHS